MKLDSTTVRDLARSFANSSLAKVWYFVTDDIRQAILDNVVMNHVRLANAVDNQSPVTPLDIVDLGVRLRETLAEGIPRGSAGRLRFTLDSEAWSGFCPKGKHGLDFKGQACDICAKGEE